MTKNYSNSEQVNRLFNADVKDRKSVKWLKNQNFKFSNSEMLEVFDVAKKFFSEQTYACLPLFINIISIQSGPLNGDVFEVFANYIGNGPMGPDRTNALIALIKKSENLTTEQKVRWLQSKNTLIRTALTVFSNFFENGLAEKCGINHKDEPYNSVIADKMMQYGYLLINENKGAVSFLWDTVASLSEDDLYSWFNFSVKTNAPPIVQIKIICECPHSTEKILKEYFFENDRLEDKMRLALHDNFPEELKMEMYEKTKDDRLLPKVISDIFLF